ncbi:Dam family site-specific DNA-(adenine-N6)-methyltransferase [soil metagenome]
MKPFLKWAGGKFRARQRIKELLPPGKRLIEPFVGAGSIFLNTDYADYLLADNNADLIALYKHLRQEGDEFIEYCRQFFTLANNTAEKYYAFRELFNATADTRVKSALFLYLNRHGYNGLCRYNSSGTYNVPFGTYTKPLFPSETLKNFHYKSQQAHFITADFVETMRQATAGDVIYCDPPFVPLSDTAKFTSYSTYQFTAAQQLQLAKEAERLAAQGITVVISNHNTEFVCETYANAQLFFFDVERFISRDIANRRPVKEVLAVFGGRT